MSELPAQLAGLAVADAAPPAPEKKKKYKQKDEAPVVDDEPTLALADLLGSTNFPRSDPRLADPTQKYYITTAINYANGSPHVGHAYEALVTDVVARYQRLAGRETRFLTGADEHGQKIANEAERRGVPPKELVDKCVVEFQALDAALDVHYDGYLRTTSDRHKACCRELWERCAKSGDISLERYEGWYDERAEAFVKQSDAELLNFCDADGIPLKRTSEECYFFRLGRHAAAIRQHIADHPDFIQPKARRMDTLKMLEDEEALEKLSVSRTTFDWGVSLPAGYKAGHVMYVWIDALTNYLTGALAEGQSLADFDASWWPAHTHVIGKDIARFHAIYWPAFLLSAGLPLPKHVFCHGFVNDAVGSKMSKSLGNVVDPFQVLKTYEADSLRYFLVKDASPGDDVKFSETALVLAHNGELADAFGNLVHRATAFAKAKCGGRVPVLDEEEDAKYARPFDLEALRHSCREAIGGASEKGPCGASEKGPCGASEKGLDIAAYAFETMAAARAANKWLTEYEPWKMKDARPRDAVLRLLLEACYALALFLAPLVPRAATKAFLRLGGGLVPTDALDANFRNLVDGAAVTTGLPLFAQLPLPGAAEAEAAAPAKKEAKAPGKKGAAVPEEEAVDYGDEADTAVSRLALVVGRITEVWHHPDSDKLFCEKIDCGAAFGGVREIGSGLRAFYAADEVKGRLVVVAANLKSKKLAGFASQGMVLCAASADGRVAFVEPPAGAQPGDRVALPGLPNPPATDKKCDKLKLFAKAQPHFNVRAGVCHYKDKPFLVAGFGPATAPADDGAAIS
ncbi:tRNA synthetases class I (M)-domain-containing protein [Pelagophyceae sp. CCMP2097]|nr:tRNA synthetases class I (M)-domain-containing protein [Pelagophyceae sp. CCMP2097]